MNEYDAALDQATAYAKAWLASLPERPVPPSRTISSTLDGPLPEAALPADEVIEMLATGIESSLMAMGSGRFFGWVIGGAMPAALAADWLTSTWDQNAAMHYATPGALAVEETAGRWVLDILGLPESDVGFVTGATMANFTGLAAARQQVLTDAGWDLDRLGLTGAPRVRVLVGEERHDTVDAALRYLGLGAPTPVPADDQGRIRVDALEHALAEGEGPVIVSLQAGNIHSGAFDPFREAIEVSHRHGAWVHVDGAFGLWAAASQKYAHLMDGCEAADSWATDAHKTLNVPYDCGLVIVARPQALRQAMGVQASYLINSKSVDALQKVPELSRRARGIPVWAALRSLGRSGVTDLVDRLAGNARALAAGIADIEGATILNDVVFTQVSVAFENDERTRAVTARLLDDGTTWMSGSRWRGRDILRISVSNWTTDEADITASLDALRRAASAVRR
jgi:glutamate/tyrosine decarboxylase-like PLP-dependent enzyme